MSIKITNPGKNYLSVLGFLGSFEIPNSPYIVRYFSTSASNRQRNSGAFELLKELKPMRERVTAKDIQDINSLLQRDLNDSRVANELIPYLKGQRGNIGFFPAILATLIPSNFLDSKDVVYPTFQIKKEKDFLSKSYNDKWIIEQFLDNGQPTNIANLKIDTYDTSIVVLDGQHRANAFRVLCNAFEGIEKGIYSNFYEGIETIDNYQADLPITLIWFETTKASIPVEPTLISRKLFVDVNNNAKPVSTSRTILLNDFEPSPVFTKFFYSFLAETHSFEAQNFSLLHSGFDVDSDLNKGNPHIITLTSPEIIHYISEWVFFGSRRYNDLEKQEVKREAKKIDISQCARILPEVRTSISMVNDDNEEIVKSIALEGKEEYFKKIFNERITPIWYRLFNDFNFLRPHYSASGELQRKRENEWKHINLVEVWDKVFCGGEGLYYSFKSIPKKKKATSQGLKDLFTTIESIESDFITTRSQKFIGIQERAVNDAYKAFRTKAFQVGYFMAFYQFLFEKIQNDISNENIKYCLDLFFERLNSISPKAWVNVLTTLKSGLIKGTDPKKWPGFQKIIFRIIQKEGEYYYQNTWTSHSPEVTLFKRSLFEKLSAYAESVEKEVIEVKTTEIETLKDGWIESSIKNVTELFSICELEPMEHISWEDIGNEVLTNHLAEEIKIQEENDQDIE